MMTRKRRDYSELLILSAVLVTVVRYAGAFIASDIGVINGWVSNAISVGMGITGLGMGILDVLGTAYIFDGWRRTMPAAGKRWPFRFKVLTVFVFMLFAVSLGILIPFTVSRMVHLPMNEVLGGWLWGWAALVNAAPFLLIGGIMTGQAHLLASSHESKAEASQAVAYHAPIQKFQCGQCGTQFETSPQLAAHVRWQHSNGKQPIPTAELRRMIEERIED